uniref:Putative bhlh transcription factor n=1 Tax=Culex tarsalis TaxID=7177 RepID=A0A1Q3EVP8_CULTA
MSIDVWCKGDEQMQDVIVEEDAVRFCRVTTEEGGGGGPGSTGGGPITMDKDEKRMRREIANSNERRRMQSINAGFQSLRQMLPHHEGEKLSKAAILQQTAEYIYALEQEKTRLLSQNCALKRDRERDQQDQHSAAAAAATPEQVTATTTTIVPVTTVAKKRKIDAIMTVSDSSDEGLGSMSPEPVSLMQVVNNATGQTIITAAGNGRVVGAAAAGPTINVSAKDYLELKHQLEVERRQKAIFEERLKALERQIYPARVLYPDVVEANEAIEEIAAIPTAKPTLAPKIGREMENVQLITLDSGIIAKKQLVAVCGGQEVIEETVLPIAKTLNIVPVKEEKVFIKRSRSRSPTIESLPIPPQPQPQPQPQPLQTTVVTLPPKKNRFPTILEAAIKAEPKVEVERINSPSSIVVNEDHLSHLTANSSKLVTSQQQQQQANSRINTCRHNLETIVEAIRHLEGDAFDSVIPAPQQQQLTISRPAAVQEVPLALTTSSKQQKERDHRQSQLEPYLKFRTAPAGAGASALTTTSTIAASSATSASSSNPSGHPAIVSVSITPTLSPAVPSAQQTASQILQQHQQCRPGVIVVKQNS